MWATPPCVAPTHPWELSVAGGSTERRPYKLPACFPWEFPLSFPFDDCGFYMFITYYRFKEHSYVCWVLGDLLNNGTMGQSWWPPDTDPLCLARYSSWKSVLTYFQTIFTFLKKKYNSNSLEHFLKKKLWSRITKLTPHLHLSELWEWPITRPSFMLWVASPRG